MDPSPVIGLAHAVHRYLKMFAIVFIKKIKVRLKVVSVGDCGHGNAEFFTMSGNFPHHIDIFGKKGLAAVKRAFPDAVPPGFIVLNGGKYPLDHLMAHGTFQPFLPVFEPVLFVAVGTTEITVVGRHDDNADAGTGRNHPMDAADEFHIGQFLRLTLSREMPPQEQPLPQRRRKSCEISRCKFFRLFFCYYIKRGIQTVNKQHPVFDFIASLYERQNNFICTSSHKTPP